MQSSLAKLVSDLVKEGMEHLELFDREFPQKEQQEMLLRKGVYPYTWMDCEKKFSVTKLPPRTKFYNELSKSHTTPEDYEHAQKVWERFHIRNMGEYHDLYLKCDVLQLGCVFERFRNMCIQNYQIDSLNFFTSAELAWSAALKITQCKLTVITDPDIYHFWESGMRGGISQVSNRYAKANNPYLPKSYDENKPRSYIMYEDCTNLYGAAMSMPLPTGGMRFLTDDEVGVFDVTRISDDSVKGYLCNRV